MKTIPVNLSDDDFKLIQKAVKLGGVPQRDWVVTTLVAHAHRVLYHDMLNGIAKLAEPRKQK